MEVRFSLHLAGRVVGLGKVGGSKCEDIASGKAYTFSDNSTIILDVPLPTNDSDYSLIPTLRIETILSSPGSQKLPKTLSTTITILPLLNSPGLIFNRLLPLSSPLTLSSISENSQQKIEGLINLKMQVLAVDDNLKVPYKEIAFTFNTGIENREGSMGKVFVGVDKCFSEELLSKVESERVQSVYDNKQDTFIPVNQNINPNSSSSSSSSYKQPQKPTIWSDSRFLTTNKREGKKARKFKVKQREMKMVKPKPISCKVVVSLGASGSVIYSDTVKCVYDDKQENGCATLNLNTQLQTYDSTFDVLQIRLLSLNGSMSKVIGITSIPLLSFLRNDPSSEMGDVRCVNEYRVFRGGKGRRGLPVGGGGGRVEVGGKVMCEEAGELVFWVLFLFLR